MSYYAVDGNLTLFVIFSVALIVALVTKMWVMYRMTSEFKKTGNFPDGIVRTYLILVVSTMLLLGGFFWSSPTTFRSEDGKRRIIIK